MQPDKATTNLYSRETGFTCHSHPSYREIRSNLSQLCGGGHWPSSSSIQNQLVGSILVRKRRLEYGDGSRKNHSTKTDVEKRRRNCGLRSRGNVSKKDSASQLRQISGIIYQHFRQDV
ncbi:hypothetical protein T265_02313 [Opisthorchis viverrini]|uniref:Uncharacterized protein n=1 Tax=Opisthorchis viverrini TaxID=6198 RepID=A0A074ZZF4_OPIVI|nr:hypothetical protein T265_02313 [Opisthorchis viverrini]KER31397.1 hypothetical protein T265_02313 [Opisthorchis viverrini]